MARCLKSLLRQSLTLKPTSGFARFGAKTQSVLCALIQMNICSAGCCTANAAAGGPGIPNRMAIARTGVGVGKLSSAKKLSTLYICTQRHKELIDPDCPHTIGRIGAEEYVWQKVNEVIKDPTVLLMGASEHVELLRGQAQTVTRDNERIEYELEKLAQERKWVITQARKGVLSDQEMEEQLAEVSTQEVALRHELSDVSELSVVAALDRWEECANQYFADLQAGIENLNAALPTEEEQHEQFLLKRQVVNTLVQEIWIGKDRRLKIVFRLDLLALAARYAGNGGFDLTRADQVPKAGTYTRTPTGRARRHRSADGG